MRSLARADRVGTGPGALVSSAADRLLPHPLAPRSADLRAPPPDRGARTRRGPDADPARARARAQPLPRLEWLRVDDWEDLDFCRLTVISTCSCTRCLPDVPVFIFWSEGRASVELSCSWKHS